MNTSERDAEICVSIQHNLINTADKCDRQAADYRLDGDHDRADDLTLAALRYRQLLARALGVWADADHLDSLRANSATDAETAACDAPTIVLEV